MAINIFRRHHYHSRFKTGAEMINMFYSIDRQQHPNAQFPACALLISSKVMGVLRGFFPSY